MTSTTEHYGLTKLGAGEGVHAGTDRFASADRDIIDQALHAAATHRHTGSTAADNAPQSAPELTLSTTGGTLPAGTTVRYKYTHVDPDTGESLPSPEATVTTAEAIVAPDAPTHTLQSIGGALEPGDYYYVLTAYQGATTVETKALNPLLVTIPAGTSTNEVTLTLPALAAGADGFNIYRRAPGGTGYLHLDSVASGVTEYVDDGSVTPAARTLPTANTTNATNSVTIDLPGATPGVPAGNDWKIYRTTTTSYSTSFLVQLAEAVLTYEDTGAATAAGAPPTASGTGASPAKVILTDGEEVQGVLPKSMIEDGGVVALSWDAATSTVETDSGGAGATLTVVDGVNPGLMTVADKARLDAMDDAATANTGTLTTVAASGATEDLPLVAAPNDVLYDVTMDQNCTFSFSGASAGSEFRARLILRGAFTPTFPAAVIWTGGSEPGYGAPAVYEFFTVDGGTVIFGRQLGSAFA